MDTYSSDTLAQEKEILEPYLWTVLFMAQWNIAPSNIKTLISLQVENKCLSLCSSALKGSKFRIYKHHELWAKMEKSLVYIVKEKIWQVKDSDFVGLITDDTLNCTLEVLSRASKLLGAIFRCTINKTVRNCAPSFFFPLCECISWIRVHRLLTNLIWNSRNVTFAFGIFL